MTGTDSSHARYIEWSLTHKMHLSCQKRSSKVAFFTIKRENIVTYVNEAKVKVSEGSFEYKKEYSRPQCNE